MKLIITKGLPGSGKSFWSKQYQKENPNTVRVNKDSLREMLHDGVHSKGRENFILKVRNFTVESALSEGHDVIVDDTNLNPIHAATLQMIAQSYTAEFVVQDFTQVPLITCIQNDLKRFNSVGSAVIYQMYNQYLKPKNSVSPIEYDPKLPCALISDIDGTLCLFGDKNPYNRDFENDLENGSVSVSLDLLRRRFDAQVLLCSGRDDQYRAVTEKWLYDHNIKYNHLFMRKHNDTRKDVIVKKEIYENEIKGKYNVYVVFDDRDQVVELWRSLGLTCFQVAEGNF